MLIGGLSLPIGLFTRFPLFMFGFALTGWKAVAIGLAFGVAQGAAGIGLLKLKPWGRELAIYVLLFGLFNMATSVFLPGSRERLEAVMNSMYASMNLPPNVPMIHFPMSVMLVSATPVLLAELYFVVTRKWAFEGGETRPEQN